MKQIKRSATFGQRRLLIGQVEIYNMPTWKCGGECVKMDCQVRPPYSSSQARQQILVWLNTLNRLGHGLVSQEVLEELQALPWTVEGNLVPCTSDRHQRQTLVHLAPSTNLQISMIHTITDMISVCSWEGNGTARFFFERSGLPADLMQWWCPRLTSSS